MACIHDMLIIQWTFLGHDRLTRSVCTSFMIYDMPRSVSHFKFCLLLMALV